MTDSAIEVNGVSKRYRLFHERNQSFKSAAMRRRRSRYEDFWALTDVSIDVPTGTNFAIVGRNGSGKSTLLKCIAQILFPEVGTIQTRGRLTALLEVGSGFHPELTGRDNIFLNGAILGIPKAEIRRKFDEIVDFSGVEKFIDQPVKNYSSGMYLRLAFAVAINVDPEILLLDEVLAVGDAGFQQKCTEKFAQFQNDGRTIVLVSHALPVLSAMCDAAVWLEDGKVQASGDTQNVLDAYDDAIRPQSRIGVDGRQRWGTGTVTIDEVEVLDRADQPFAHTITPGTPVRIRIHYTAHEALTDPLFTIVISAIDGTVVWSGNSLDTVEQRTCAAGTGFVGFEIASLPIAGGDFILSAAINELNSHVIIDYVKDIARIQVAAHRRNESGYISIDGEWIFSGQESLRLDRA